MKRLFVCLALLAASALSSDLVGQRKEVPISKENFLIKMAPHDSSTGVIKITSKGYLGVFTDVLQPSDSLVFPVLVSVEPGSPAHAAGLMAGDTILSFNGVSARGSFSKIHPLLIPRAKINFKIARNGVRELVATVGERSQGTFVLGTTSSHATFSIDMSQLLIPILSGIIVMPDSNDVVSFAGAEAVTVNKELSTSLKLNITGGVLILNIRNNTPAHNGGLKAGDVILKIDNIRVTNVKDLNTAATKGSAKKVSVQVSRNGKLESKTVQLASSGK